MQLHQYQHTYAHTYIEQMLLIYKDMLKSLILRCELNSCYRQRKIGIADSVDPMKSFFRDVLQYRICKMCSRLDLCTVRRCLDSFSVLFFFFFGCTDSYCFFAIFFFFFFFFFIFRIYKRIFHRRSA